MNRRKRNPSSSDLTSDFLAGKMDSDHLEGEQRFSRRSKFHQQNKTARTTLQRTESNEATQALPLGRVIQVFSRLCEVDYQGTRRLCVIRKTLERVSATAVVVGDFVRFRDDPRLDSSVQQQGVIEGIEPRKTILTRADSFKAIENHPIVANAEQMLIVASVVQPSIKWGLIDRMLIAAQSGGLVPILCLNKIDLLDDTTRDAFDDAAEKLAYYASLGIRTLQTSVVNNVGLDEARTVLNGKITVISGHSGVGKSSLARAIEPSLDLRIGEISQVHLKGKHTTTSARIYPLGNGLTGEVIDTPGVKMFGLWNVDSETLDAFFPDIENESAPPWRVESYERIVASLGKRR